MRLIDADALEYYGNHIGDKYEDRFHHSQWIFRSEIDLAPTIDIVRCKDCAYVKRLLEPIENTDYLICHKYYHAIDCDDYCSYGVKTERSE